MADDDSSKLRAQITFLTNLIKSHKEVPQASNRKQEIPTTQKSNNNSHTAFSWQRKSQPDVGKKTPSVASQPSSLLKQDQTAASTKRPVVKSSYILDRRKQTTNSPDPCTARTNSTVSTIPGSSGSSQTLNKAKPTEAANSSLASIRTSASRGIVTSALAKPTISTGKPLPLLSTSSKSLRTSGLPHSSSSTRLVNSTSLTRNPYVLNKKETPSVAGTKTVAQKSELRWTRPSSSSFSAPKNVSSHSDSEVYTKKSKLSSSKQLSSLYFARGDSSAMVRGKAPSTSNVQVSSYKWSRTEPGAYSNLFVKKSLKRTKFMEPRLKWTPQAGLRRQMNPYVLKKSSLSSGKTAQKSRIMLSKTTRTSKVAKMSPYSFTNQNSHVWRSGRVLKLDRRKSWSNAQSTSHLSLVGTRKSSVGFMERRQKAVLRDTCTPVVTRYSIVRSKRKQAPIKTQKSNKVIVIGGIPYKSSANKLTRARSTSSRKESKAKATHTPAGKIGKLTKTVNIRGEKFVMDSKGKSLQRISKAPEPQPGTSKQSHTATVRRRLSAGRVIIGGITYLQTKPTTLVRSKTVNTQNKTLASRVLRRSIQNARLYKKIKQKSATEQYCMFFNRFGKCNKRERCPYIHDPSKVAVCTKFLRGRCKNTDGSCPFSHKIDRDKMPVCQFFLRGKCFNDNCPYSHVNVSKKAEVCEDFLRGFCSRGQQCTKKHIIECEEFSRTGKCSRGKKCKLIHRTRKTANLKRKAPLEEERSSTKQARVDFSSDEGFLPLADITDTEKNSVQGSKDDISADTEGMAVEPVVIRPRFLKTKESAEK